MAIERPKLKLHRGSTYVFDVSDPSLASHPLRFTNDSGTTEYTNGVTATGNSGSVYSTVTFAVPNNAPDNLMYYCGTHGIGMGNKVKIIDDPSTPQFAHAGDRGLFCGSFSGTSNAIDYVTISTPGNAIDFGDMLRSSGVMATASNGTIGILAGGSTSFRAWDGFNDIDYVTFATAGNATNAGQFNVSRRTHGQGLYSSGYAYIVGGQATSSSTGNSKVTEIEYFTLATTISSIGDFGDITIGASNGIISASAQDTTRGVLFNTNSYTTTNSIDYLTIGGTSGNSSSFGNLTLGRVYGVGLSGSTRGVYVGGSDGTEVGTANTPAMQTMDYITIQTTGNASDFGDTISPRFGPSGSSNGTTGVYGGDGSSTHTPVDSIEYITIDTTGNGTDFGDLVVARVIGARGMSGNAA